MSDITITFTYDHASGNYHGRIGSGAKFLVRRKDVGGNLENALNSFKKKEIDANAGKYAKPRQSKDFLKYEYPEHLVREFDEHGREISLDIGLEDLKGFSLNLGIITKL